jgi:acyl-CoA dehydrogenase
VISFGMTEEQEVVRDAMREFAEQAMRPIGRECEEASSIPDDFLDSVWSLGLTSTQIPESYGGGGEERSPVTNVILLEELAFGDAALAAAAMAPSAFVNAIVDQGTDEQKAKYLPAFCEEQYRAAALACIEPGAFTDPAQPRTLAEDKEDHFVLSGTKCFVPMGQRASHLLVTARCGDRTDAFIVPRDAEGVTVSEPEKNLGLRALTTNSVELQGVEVPASDRLGGESGSNVRRILDTSRVALAATMLGVSRSVLEYCVPYVKDRVAFVEEIAK